jgi:hypothetical protein
MGSVDNAWRVLDVAIIGGGIGRPTHPDIERQQANHPFAKQEVWQLLFLFEERATK